MKLLVFGCFLLPALAPTCLSQQIKTRVEVYIQLDGKPLKDAGVTVTPTGTYDVEGHTLKAFTAK